MHNCFVILRSNAVNYDHVSVYLGAHQLLDHVVQFCLSHLGDYCSGGRRGEEGGGGGRRGEEGEEGQEGQEGEDGEEGEEGQEGGGGGEEGQEGQEEGEDHDYGQLFLRSVRFVFITK